MAKKASAKVNENENPADETRRDIADLKARVTALEEWRGRGNVRDNPDPDTASPPTT